MQCSRGCNVGKHNPSNQFCLFSVENKNAARMALSRAHVGSAAIPKILSVKQMSGEIYGYV